MAGLTRTLSPTCCAAVMFAVMLWAPPAAPAGSSASLIDDGTPWRVHLVTGPGISRTDDDGLELRWRHRSVPFDPTAADAHETTVAGHAFSPLPPRDWMDRGFDDHHWPRYQPDELFDYIGDWGVAIQGGQWLTSMQMRTMFGIADPRRVRNLKVTVSCIGGAVVYVNGEEVGRGYMPDGDLRPMTLAEDYPAEAYVDEDGSPLPEVGPLEQPQEQWVDRYDKRIRTFTVEVPADVLRQGANVLAIDIRRAPPAGPMDDHWNHLGFREVTLTGAGEGVIAYGQAVSGTRLWSAEALEPVTETLPEESLVRRRWGWGTVGQVRGRPVKGTVIGNPFEPVRPIRMAVPRNGVGSGQAVLSDPDGLVDIRAELSGDLRGPDGATMPADAVDIRFAVEHDGVHYCDALMQQPPQEAATVPVWLLVEAPRGQRPGWYESTLRLEANGKQFTTDVQVLVTGFELPDPRDFGGSDIYLAHSPKSVAMQYDVEMWSDEHFRLMEGSIRLQAKAGNDLVFAPVILSHMRAVPKSWMGSRPDDRDRWHEPMVRFIETDDGLEPDFSILERYLDLYARHAGPPRALSLGVWSAATASDIHHAYGRRGSEGRPERVEPRSPLEVLVWDPATGQTSDRAVPAIVDDEGEAFWRPLLEGVHEVVRKRGWDERIIMLGLAGDVRPGQETVERVKEWAPWARWDLLSHFSADPAPEQGRAIGLPGLEVGVNATPGGSHADAGSLEGRVQQPLEFLALPTGRWRHADFSPPVLFRTMPQTWGRLGHIGLDFWRPGGEGPRNHGFWAHINALVVPGPDGAVPTVRYQMLRQGVQDAELRMAIVRAYLELPEDERRPYRELIDELFERTGGTTSYISQRELAYDWPDYFARLQQAAAELAGTAGDATWDRPPGRQ